VHGGGLALLLGAAVDAHRKADGSALGEMSAVTACSILGSVWSESVSHSSRGKPAGGASSVAVVGLGVQQLGPGTVQE
jgi:hypothetical protein